MRLIHEKDPNISYLNHKKYTTCFYIQARGVTAGISLQELNQKLTLLILHFPSLRLAWCPSPAVAAEFFHEIKVGRDQPDAATAAAIGADSEDSCSAISQKYNSAPYVCLHHQILIKEVLGSLK